MKRIDYKAFYQISADFSQAEVRKIMPMLVPVERCEHGYIDPHRTANVNPTIGWGDHRTCPGAGIGGDDELSLSDSTRRTSDRIGGDDE